MAILGYILLVLLTLLTVLLVWVLFAPLRMYVNTDARLAWAELYGLVGAGVVWPEDKPEFRMRVLGFRVKPGTKKKKEPKQEKKPAAEKEKKSRRPDMRVMFREGWKILGTFQVKTLRVELDTGSNTLNAWLIPVFSIMNSRQPVQCNVNFQDRLSLECRIENRIYRMLPMAWRIGRSFWRRKNNKNTGHPERRSAGT